ncbi:MAG: enoyl-CoA hydratase family protein [Planctomycetota bacterium]|jgi:enoyl-CoA hydratase/carnithine racemase
MAVPYREEIDSHGVSLITLDRPERLNALTFEVYRTLTDRFAAMQDDPSVHAVVITGEGRAFCSGGDVNDIIGKLVDMPHDEVLAFTRMTGELIANMRKLEKPIVAAVNGVAAGAGAVIALASDLRIFSAEARIAFLFTKVGLTGADMGAGYLLPRIVGQGRATELLMLGDTIDAAIALRYGLTTHVVPPNECLSTAMEMAGRLARGPLAALATTKRLLEAEWLMDLDTAIEAEAQAQAVHLKQPDHREYHQAFTQKRKARFSGEAGT